MAKQWNTSLLAHVDCEGGGQVWVEGATMYVSHMRPPYGTSIYDVEDPRRPRLLASLEVPIGWHSQGARARRPDDRQL